MTDAGAYNFQVQGNMYSTTGPNVFNATSGETLIGTTTDAGDYRLQVSGAIYNTAGAVLAASSGNVGVGTANPGYKLDVSGNLRSTTDAFIATTSGNLTIGTTSTQFDKLTVLSNTNTAASIRTTGFGSIASPIFIDLNFRGTGSDSILQTRARIRSWDESINTSRGYLTFWTINAAVDTLKERARLDYLGNFGIGTTSPSERLHVNGRARIATIDSSASPINMLWADVNGVVRKAPVPSVSISGGTTDFIPLWSSSTALTSSVIKQVSSEILIGYTTDQGTFKLQVDGNTFTNGSIKTAAPSGGTAAEWKLGTVVAGSYTAASNYLQVDVGGTLYYIGLVTPD
jgi:hypothetical protein